VSQPGNDCRQAGTYAETGGEEIKGSRLTSASLGDELEVVRDLAATRQGEPQSCDVLDVAAQFYFFFKKSISGGAVFHTLIRKMRSVRGEKFPGG
jgi:hypothetical protein